MLLTYNLRHGLDLSGELENGRRVAEAAISSPRLLSSKDVSRFGLKSMISNQIIRKYGRNRTIKCVRNVVLPVPGQGIVHNGNKLWIPCLKLELPFYPRHDVVGIKYAEFDDEYVHVTCDVRELREYVPECTVGVDLNITGHLAVASCLETGKVMKLGKECNHIRKEYHGRRKKAQKQGAQKNNHRFREAKKLRRKEHNKKRNENHKIANAIVAEAERQKAVIVLEDLTSIRKAKTFTKTQRRSLHSWSFRQVQTLIGYKAKLLGVPVRYVSPEYTSQICSKCGCIGERDGKIFQCPHCGHADQADANAAFNIASRGRSYAERVAYEGCTDTPKGATFYIEDDLFGVRVTSRTSRIHA